MARENIPAQYAVSVLDDDKHERRPREESGRLVGNAIDEDYSSGFRLTYIESKSATEV